MMKYGGMTILFTLVKYLPFQHSMMQFWVCDLNKKTTIEIITLDKTKTIEIVT